jgi:phosphoenolpyruvate carboxykinase (ATP)
MRRDRFFGLWVPKACPDIPQELLNPEQTWDDRTAYQRQAQEQSLRFIQNFEQFAGDVTPKILAAGPGVPA